MPNTHSMQLLLLILLGAGIEWEHFMGLVSDEEEVELSDQSSKCDIVVLLLLCNHNTSIYMQ